MRILLVTPIPPQAAGAGAIPVLLDAQLRGLRDRHEVTVMTVAGPDPHEMEAVRSLAADEVTVQAAERGLIRGRLSWPTRFRMVRAWSTRRWPFRTVWFWEPALQRMLDDLGDRSTFDVLLAEDNAVGVYDFPVGRIRVLTEHEVRKPRAVTVPPLHPLQWPAWAFREIDWARWRRYQRRVWARFDLVQVFTERDRDTARTIAPELISRFRVNPFPVRLPVPAPEREEPDTVAFLGNFSHPPNVDAAVWLADEIMPYLRASRCRVQLRLIGPFAPPAVQALATTDIEVMGEVPDAGAIMARTAVIVAPIRTGGGMRMKVLHAMAFGKAVVTTTRGTEGLTTEGRVPPLVVADDARGIADHIAQLLCDTAARQSLGAAARDFVEQHHSPDAYRRRLEKILEEVRPQ